MAKDKISDYSSTANSNTDIAGINIDEGCAPSGINDAIRTLMAQLKTWQSGGQDIYIHPAGSAAAPSITATGDTNTGVFFPAADTVGITTGGTERARVDSSGNLGLGTTSPTEKLSVAGGACITGGYNGTSNGGAVNITYSSNKGSIYALDPTVAWKTLEFGGSQTNFLISGSQAMTLDASGRLLVGSTSITAATANKVIEVNGTGDSAFNVSVGGTNYGYVYSDTSAMTVGSRQSVPLVFNTANAERARIDSSGNLLVGTTSTDSGAKTRIVYGSGANGIQIKDSADTSNTAFVIFQNGSNSNIGTISRVGTTNVVAYNTTSDQRLKNDLGIAVSDTVIDSLVIHDFSWKTDGTLDRGVFAQEAAIVKPLAVRKGSDELDENGNPKNPWGVDYSKFVPDLIVYCQELKKQVQQLQADVAALKA